MSEDQSVADVPATEAAETPAGIADIHDTSDSGEAQPAGIADEPGEGGDQQSGEGEKPEAYELSPIEGFDIPEDNLKSFGERCNKLGLSKEQAEGILAWHKEQADALAAGQQQIVKETIKGWDDELRKDPVFGGQAYKRTYADAVNALNRFDEDGSLRQVLRETGFQYHPAVIKAIARVGSAMGEHDLIGRNGEGTPTRPLEERLWKS